MNKQKNIEQSLAQALYRLGNVLHEQADSEELDLARATVNTQLQALIACSKWRILAENFSLSKRELSLLAIVYLFQLEPDLLSVYMNLSWYERGPGISMARALWLITDENFKGPASLLYDDENFGKSIFVQSQLLVRGDELNPMSQQLLVSKALFNFMAGNALKEGSSNPLAAASLNGYIRPIHQPSNKATAIAFRKQMRKPLSGLNTIKSDSEADSLAFVNELFNHMDAEVLDTYRLWLVHSSLENIHLDAQAIYVFEQAILSARLHNLPAKLALYWPEMVSDCMGSSLLRKLVEFLVATEGVVIFCKHFHYDEKTEKSLWLSDVLQQAVTKFTLQPTQSHLVKAWLALGNQQENAIELTKAQANVLVERYPLSTSQMAEIYQKVSHHNERRVSFELLQKACLSRMKRETDGLAKFYLPRIRLADMVLEDFVNVQLNEILARFQYKTVLESQTPNSLLGTLALLWGQPGTGKSMAAEALAGELGLPMYKVNLANVASKWIGESEKHLAKLFDRAEKQKAVLLFDEADAIFAKRSEVESSHDKNANMGVSFLLQRIESYDGILLLSTNFKSNIDSAFLRRFSSVIEFPMPSKDLRAILWHRVWTGNIKPEASVNFEYLAAEFELSPSQIRNTAERACLYALMASQNSINQTLLANALKRELDKQSAGFLANQQLASWPIISSQLLEAP